MATRASAIVVTILGAVLFGCAKEKPPESKVSAAEARTLAEEAFVFGMPLLYYAVNQGVMTNVPKPEGGRAPYNQFAHFREFPDPSNRTVVAWNVDTLYSIGTLDLTAEPLVLSIPPMGDRWWLMQLLDAWNDVPAAPGTRTEGNGGGNFALVGPNWSGQLPADVKEIRLDTSLVALGGRTYTAGPADYAAVHKIQDQYKLTPLSKWGTDYAPPESVPVAPDVDPRTPVGDQVFKMTPEAYFNRLNELLVNNPPRAADAPLVERIAKLGIKPGAKFSLEGFDPEVRAAIAEGVANAQKAILEHESKMGKQVNGWSMALDGGRYGTNYLNRAAWTYFAIGTNLAEDAVYPNATKDSDGNALSGESKYVLRFPKDEMPPAQNFWSLTMYDKDGYLVENPIKRYSVGDRSKFKYDADGALTIHIQRESPGRNKESNWLPTPAGAFKVYLRLYTPKQEVLDGNWAPPAVQKGA